MFYGTDNACLDRGIPAAYICNMNQKGNILPILVILFVVIAVGLGTVWYFTRQIADKENQDQAGIIVEEESAVIAPPDEDFVPLVAGENFTGNMQDLIANGRDLTCAFNQTDDAESILGGTVYISGANQKIRGDIILNESGEIPVEAHIIRTDGFNYFWSDQLDQGAKIPIDSLQNVAPDDDIDTSQEFIADEFVYTCRPWIVDDAMFVLPEEKEFVDLTGQIQGINATVEEVQENPCSACQELQGPAQDQCLQALGC